MTIIFCQYCCHLHSWFGLMKMSSRIIILSSEVIMSWEPVSDLTSTAPTEVKVWGAWRSQLFLSKIGKFSLQKLFGYFWSIGRCEQTLPGSKAAKLPKKIFRYSVVFNPGTASVDIMRWHFYTKYMIFAMRYSWAWKIFSARALEFHRFKSSSRISPLRRKLSRHLLCDSSGWEATGISPFEMPLIWYWRCCSVF